ncbi:hypothetical protein FOZ63_002765 [Perkinsus olseni]|uniref:Uncharacterized protein n=2 Tax=Perkinsus olseni TaxID=32597 RepID=A0A7J6P428_PEROL|nr:hypothetical protein FOZ60_016718 [Perkinsus olseni]KAF4750406.1 hypothetical protein FOZ63_002765 [Perkinsus olseni]
MYAFKGIIVIATIVSSELDWSSIRLDGPATTAPSAEGLNLSEISLDGPPSPLPDADGLDLSSISLDGPSSSTEELDLSSISLDGPSSLTEELDLSSIRLEGPWSSTPAAGGQGLSKSATGPTTDAPSKQQTAKADDNPPSDDRSTSDGCSEWPVALLGILVAVTVACFIGSIIQIYLLKKLLARTLPRDEADLEQGYGYSSRDAAEVSVKEVAIGI